MAGVEVDPASKIVLKGGKARRHRDGRRLRGGLSRRHRASWSYSRRRWWIGAGPNTRSPATSPAMSTGRRWIRRPANSVCCRRFGCRRLIHTRSGAAKWLNEIAQCNPLWLHPSDGDRLGLADGDLVRVRTEIGYFVDRVWLTEGIRPGVVACSHHLGRWRRRAGRARQSLQRQRGRHLRSRSRANGWSGRSKGRGRSPARTRIRRASGGARAACRRT